MRYLTRDTKGVVVHKETTGDDYYTRDGAGGDEAWKLDVGAECNILLKLADQLDSTHAPVCPAIRSIVARVHEFESLETEAK